MAGRGARGNIDRMSPLSSITAHNEDGNRLRIAESLHSAPKVAGGW